MKVELDASGARWRQYHFADILKEEKKERESERKEEEETERRKEMATDVRHNSLVASLRLHPTYADMCTHGNRGRNEGRYLLEIYVPTKKTTKKGCSISLLLLFSFTNCNCQTLLRELQL